MPELLAHRLSQLPFFSHLPCERAVALARQAQERTLGAGETLYLQNQPSAGLWVVEEGYLKIYRLHPDGREYILLLIGPGQVFNEIPAIDGQPNPANAMTLSPVRAWNLPAEVMRRALESDRQMALAVIDLLAAGSRLLVQRVEDLALCSVTTRLARFLRQQGTGQTPNGPGITRVTIAAHLATTPETISRSLRTLEQIGAIAYTREQVTVIRPDVLDTVAMQ